MSLIQRHFRYVEPSFETALTALGALAAVALSLAAVSTPGPAPVERVAARPEPRASHVDTVAGPAKRDSVVTRDTVERLPRRYVVEPGDSLWAIAAQHYDDVPEAMSRIKKRNGLRRTKVLAGEVLVLPAPRSRRG